MPDKIIRVITRAADGSLRTKDFDSFAPIEQLHEQIGLDDCSTDLDLRGMPVFRGLIGPMPDGKNAVRYESPDVFEVLTKEWTKKKAKRRRRRSAKEMAEAAALEAAQTTDQDAVSRIDSKPHFPLMPTQTPTFDSISAPTTNF